MATTAHVTRVPDSLDWDQFDLYRFFGLAFGQPSKDRFQWLNQPDLPGALASLWARLGCEGDFPSFSGFDNYAQYESAYIALFDVGLPQPPVSLFESAHDNSQPPQQTALENTHFYDVLGLKTDYARTAPDHLLTQLEFLSAARYAREHSTSDENLKSLAHLECDFLDRHLLNWIPLALEAVERIQPPLFPLFFALLLAFLRRRREHLGSLLSRT